MGGCWPGEAVAAKEKRGILGDWLQEHIRLSLVGPKLGVETGKLPVINQVLDTWG